MSNIIEFTPQSFIDKGVPITQNFLIDHLTGGAFHPAFGHVLPIYGSPINPQMLQNIPLWKLARNLSITAEATLEPLFKEFGASLTLRTGFLNFNISGSINSEIGHMAGLSLDIQVKGFEGSLGYLAKDIQSIARRASSMSLVFDSSSWMHINVNPQRALQSSTRLELPPIKTLDLINQVVENGIQNFRGTF